MDDLARVAELQSTYGTANVLAAVVIVALVAALALMAGYAKSRLRIEAEDRKRQAEERAALFTRVLGDGNGNKGALSALETEVRLAREQGSLTHAMVEAHLAGGPPSRQCIEFIRAEIDRAAGGARLPEDLDPGTSPTSRTEMVRACRG